MERKLTDSTTKFMTNSREKHDLVTNLLDFISYIT